MGRLRRVSPCWDTLPVDSTRRGFLRSAGLAGVGAGVLAAGGDRALADAAPPAAVSPAGSGVVPFYGKHQAGIATPNQEHLQFAALDVVRGSLADLRDLVRAWTRAAAAMASGRPVGPIATGPRPPADTGEAVGLGPADLTITFGFGPTLFRTAKGKDRFGLARHRPAPLVDLPPFLGDRLRTAISGGDLAVQVCANQPQVAFHAVHDLIRIARPVARPRWLLAGFGGTGNSTARPIPRNLMGFHDGTANIMASDAAALDRFVWADAPSSPAWMRGGSYLVARRIQIDLGRWDATSLDGQEQAVGRAKLAGTVLSPMPPDAHILIASPQQNGGQRILRRGFGYADGVDGATGAPVAGLMFLCYQRDPRVQFIPLQTRLSAFDTLSRSFLTHVGSAVFACPPGTARGGYIGEGLLG